ncbi:hypothetical protein [Haloarchaeobius sp. HRN-SO-5]|uniref:hypothetical protein n=1 Tax=Haloarchaeobius sp. HRN-SO-5 TaxID=3446118 RepID=UPI003EB734E5
MARELVDRNLFTRLLFAAGVVVATALGGFAIGSFLDSLGVPGGYWVGTALGALIVLAAAVSWYRQDEPPVTGE